MVGRGKVFSELISFICVAGFPIYVELFLIFLSLIQYKRMSIALDLRCLMVPVAMPNVVELSI